MPDAAPVSASAAVSTLRLVVERDAIARNYRRLQDLAPTAEIAAVVKADAYGLGAAALAPRLAREGCRTFFVASIEEGAQLRRALRDAEADIWVYNGYRSEERAAFVEHRLGAILNHPGDLDAFAAAPAGPCAIHLDTGMNRLGFAAEEAEALIAAPERLAALDLRLILSHLACSEETGNPMNAAQRTAFAALAERLPPRARLSLANTGGALLGEAYHFDMVRPGVALFGATADPDAVHGFEPVVRLEAPVLQLRRLKPGDAVGYGASYVADAPRLAATVAAGYADGLPRAFAGAGYARLGGAETPVLGRISMDLTVLDVSDPKAEAAARAGAPAIFLGADLARQARAAGTLPYELLTGLSRRAARVYEGAS